MLPADLVREAGEQFAILAVTAELAQYLTPLLVFAGVGQVRVGEQSLRLTTSFQDPRNGRPEPLRAQFADEKARDHLRF
jgi:hypothetical protein